MFPFKIKERRKYSARCRISVVRIFCHERNILHEMSSTVDNLKNAQKPTFGILMVATNEYLELWQETVFQILKFSSDLDENVRIHLFTNKVSDAKIWIEKYSGDFGIFIHEIPAWGWPEATLLRYSFFREAKEYLKEDLLIYLDSDMDIRSNFIAELKPSEWENGLAFVQHPGFFRPKGWKRVLVSIISPKLLIQDLKKIFKGLRALGDWENRPDSLAFVPRKLQKQYVHGAIWFGRREQFLAMVSLLAERTNTDLDNGVIAKWHDESHLNWFASSTKVSILGNEFSGVAGYANLRFIQPLVVSRKKNGDIGRTPTNKVESQK